ncbi:MAG: GerMN domain-containing protein [Ignavibacteriales bacterium]
MKKTIKFLVVLFMVIMLPGCFAEKENLKVKDFFPISSNTLYEFEGTGNEYAQYNVFIDYTSDNKIQKRINNGGTSSVEVLELTSNAIKRVYKQGESYYISNRLNETNTDEVLLKEPITKGTKWDVEGGERSITGVNVSINTPSGDYKAVEVTTKTDDNVIKDYYVKNLGFVKSVFKLKDSEVVSSLKKVTTTPLKQQITFYYPNDSKILFKNKEISFNTNDNIISIIEAEYKKSVNNIKSPFSNGTKINKIDISSSSLTIDLNGKFIEEMNAGSGYESLILKSIVNTFGSYYQKEKVIITIDDKLYQSGHFSFKKDEYILVDTKNIEEIK